MKKDLKSFCLQHQESRKRKHIKKLKEEEKEVKSQVRKQEDRNKDNIKKKSLNFKQVL